MNQRDLELLSSYLDGQLTSDAERARLETRLASDRNLRAVLDDLRAARGLLRQLPMRKAPRNFTLTPGMVGRKPPLPRAYPAFRFVTTLATLMLFFTFGLNFLAPQIASPGSGFGMGGGGAPEIYSAQEAPAATEMPAVEAPAAEAPAATEAPAEPSLEMVPIPTQTLSAEESARQAVTPAAKEGEAGDVGAEDQSQVQDVPPPQVETPPPVPITWQVLLAGIALVSAIIMLMMRRLAAERWRRK